MPEFISRDEWIKRIPVYEADGVPLDICLRKFGGLEVIKSEVDLTTGMVDIDFVISTPTLDREDDVLMVDGWEIDNYMRNPVVLWAHDYGRPPVARSEKVWVEDEKLISRDRFTPQEINPFGHMVYQMVKGGFLRATSVGFRPLEYFFNDEHKGYDFLKSELMEHSIVPVPANPEALVAASAAGIDTSPLIEWAAKILDDDPEKDRVALWLPRETVAEVHAALSNVAVSLMGSSTTAGITTGKTITEGGTFDATALEGGTAPATPTVADIKINIEPSEAIMEKAIQALSDIIRELNESVKALPDLVAETVEAKLAEAQIKTPPDEDDISEEDMKTIVADAVKAALTAATGKLPG